MPPLPPIDFDALFRDPRMFDTRDTFRAAGFEVKNAADHNIMVGSHPSVPAYLFKKYDRGVRLDDQRENYEKRVKGSHAIKRFIEEHALRHIVVPQKWIFDLPSSFSRRGKLSRLLVVERIEILETKETEQRYRNIGEGVLDELCRVLIEFRGLDSAIHNVRFTASGQIAFIDTENWYRNKKHFLPYIRRELTKERRRFADRLYKELIPDDDDD